VRKRLVGATSEASSSPSAAEQAVAFVVAARREAVAAVAAMTVPSGAAATQATLVSAFRLSLESDLLYQRWISTRSAVTLGQAQANDKATVVVKGRWDQPMCRKPVSGKALRLMPPTGIEPVHAV
jgi:hypothetical protein